MYELPFIVIWVRMIKYVNNKKIRYNECRGPVLTFLFRIRKVKSGPGDWLSWLLFSVIFLSFSKKMQV
jgi:hypothetical protein